MLSPKQASYINLGLQDRLKCVYYCPEDKDYVVYINSNNDKTISSVIYGIKFEDNQKAEYFA